MFTVPKPCSLDFRFSIRNTSSLNGFDLALYKANEPKAALSDIYELWFLLGESATDTSIKIVLMETINASCSGWQMFHLDYDIMLEFLQVGVNFINFELLVFKNDDYYSLPCDEVHSLFVFNATAHRKPASSPNPTNGTNGTNATKDGETTTPAAEGGSKTQQNPFSIEDERVMHHVPVLNVFEKRPPRKILVKRAVKPSPVEFGPASEFNTRGNTFCQRRDRWVQVNDTIWLNGENIAVLAPTVYNARACSVDKALSHGKMTSKCQPIVEKPVKLLLERWQQGRRQVFIYESFELKVIEECG